MERVFPVEEVTDSFWASSSSSPHSAAGSSDPKAINRSPSEWAFQRFLREAVVPPDSPSPSVVSTAAAANANVRSSASSCYRREKGGGDDEPVETKVPPPPPPPPGVHLPPQLANGGAPPVSNIPLNSDRYPEYLKEQLNLACAFALSRVRLDFLHLGYSY